MGNETNAIPMGRILEKLDGYFAVNDIVSAEKHLRYWLSEAEKSGNDSARLTILNEMTGLYRSMGKKEEGLRAIDDLMALLASMQIEDSVPYATTLLNVATGMKAFGKAAESLPLYEKARAIYEERLPENDEKLAGLYNNMALALMESRNFEAARELFQKAMAILAEHPGKEGEMAITCLNLADLCEAEYGPEEAEEQINAYLDKAENFLDSENLRRDGHYAFVCRKCARTFGYYGRFVTEAELLERAETSQHL